MNGSRITDFVKLVFCILVCQLAGFVGSVFTTPLIPTWYASLNKPFFNPPNWVFAPVWLTLFLLMGASLFLVWRRGTSSKGVKKAMGVFALQLILNVLWSVVFFGLKSPAGGFITIVLLWLSIAWTIVTFNKTSRASALLLIPYIMWVTFAAILNFSVVMLN